MGRTLGLTVIAEGIERTEQLEALRGMSGRYAQGFLFGSPQSALGIGELLGASWTPEASADFGRRRLQ